MKRLLIVVVVLILVAAGWKTVMVETTRAEEVSSKSLFTTRSGNLRIVVTENGYLKAKNSVRIKPKFEREGTITWLIDEGSEVKENDVLVEFDKTELENQIGELETSLIQFVMEQEAGAAELGIQERDNETVIEKAELALELAGLGLERYEKGEAPNELRKKNLAYEKAESEHQRAKERFERVPELEKEGFLTAIEVEAERINLREAEINVENAKRDLDLYETHTHRMELTKLRAAVKDAERDLENAHIKAAINLKQKKAQVTQQERRVNSTKMRIAALNEELEHMTLRAPQDGVVHYGDPSRPWYRDQIKVGNSLRQGNTAITLPDLNEMQVLIQVHEADIDLVALDMPVIVTIETHKGLTFPAKVTEIATVASSQSWDDETNKTFRVEVTMDPTEVELRAGVTARAEIQVEEIADTLQVPIHAVLPEGDRHFCFVHSDGVIEERDVVVGKNNAHFVQVVEGLEEGEKLLLYDPRQGHREALGSIGAAPEEATSPAGGAGAE